MQLAAVDDACVSLVTRSCTVKNGLPRPVASVSSRFCRSRRYSGNNRNDRLRPARRGRLSSRRRPLAPSSSVRWHRRLRGRFPSPAATSSGKRPPKGFFEHATISIRSSESSPSSAMFESSVSTAHVPWRLCELLRAPVQPCFACDLGARAIGGRLAGLVVHRLEHRFATAGVSRRCWCAIVRRQFRPPLGCSGSGCIGRGAVGRCRVTFAAEHPTRRRHPTRHRETRVGRHGVESCRWMSWESSRLEQAMASTCNSCSRETSRRMPSMTASASPS